MVVLLVVVSLTRMLLVVALPHGVRLRPHGALVMAVSCLLVLLGVMVGFVMGVVLSLGVGVLVVRLLVMRHVVLRLSLAVAG